MFTLIWTFFKKLMIFADTLYEFILNTRLRFPIFVTIVGQGSVQWFDIGFWDLIGASFIVFIVSWLISKIAPVL